MKVTVIRGRSTDSTVYRLARTLQDNNFNVQLLLWDRNDTLNNFSDNVINIKRFNFKAPQDKFSAILFFPIWWTYELIFLLKDDSDVFHACDLDTIIPATIAKIIKKKKMVYTIYDFYSNNMPNMRPYFITNIIRFLVGSIEKFFIGFADVLFLVDECRKEEIRGSKINSIDYIYNSPPDIEFCKTNLVNVCKPFTIFYAGGMHSGRGIEYMIKAIDNLDNVKLILAGPESDFERLRKAQCLNDNVQYVGWLPSYDDVLKYTIGADVLFRFNDPKVPKSRYESPNKLFEAMMAGKPIITNNEIGASKIVKDENCGIIVPYGDVYAIKNAIMTLMLNENLRNMLGNNGRKAYEEKYSYQIMENRIINMYNLLIAVI